MSDDGLTPKESLTAVVNRLVERFHPKVEEFRGEITLEIGPEQVLGACQLLSEEEEFDSLIDETAVDYWPQEKPRFYVMYQIRSIQRNQILALRVPLEGNEPVMPSVTSVYPNADYYERELWDLFGIRFAGHPDLRRILMPHDWVGHPLRKDYPLGYEEPQYTFNYDRVQARKLSPKE